ncbi:MAG TPA: DMT family transporter [Ilumatobacteraceae bacterium]|nr:DMT family transporter [Ilumatobacteraceae bacterium]
MDRTAVIRCALAAVLFGASAPAASELAGELDAFTLAGLLYVGAALAVLPATLRRPPTVRSLRRGGSRLAVAVVVGGAVAPVLLAAGLARTPAATASLLLNLELVATVALAAAVFHEHIGRRVALGTTLVVAGGAALAWSSSPELRVGALLVVAACVCWAVDNCVTAELDELAPHHITMAKGVIAGSANLAIGLLVAARPPVGAIVAGLVIGALGYGLSITLWVAGARDLGAARAQLIFAAAPFVGAVLAWVVLGEPVTLAQGVAVVLAGSGVAAVAGSAHLHEHRHDALDHDHEHVHDGHHDHVHGEPVDGRHQHPHRHRALVHSHPHVPDLHHRHDHG